MENKKEPIKCPRCGQTVPRRPDGSFVLHYFPKRQGGNKCQMSGEKK